MSSSEASEAAKATRSRFAHHPWAQHAAYCRLGGRGGFFKIVGGATILFFTVAGVRSVFGCNDHYRFAYHPDPESQQIASGDGAAVPADSREHHRGPRMWGHQWRERMLNDRDEMLRAEFNQKFDELKQSIESSSQTASEATGGKFWGSK